LTLDEFFNKKLNIRMEVSIKSPAKVNLHLEIIGRRNDEYHEIISLFQSITLFDEISVRAASGNRRCEIQGQPDIPLKDNLIYRAVKLFLEESGIDSGFSVNIVKRIPMGAGLGGGSGNAAAVLEAINILCGTKWDTERLGNLGIRLGSDVPFFLKSVAAIVRGRGEEITGLKPRVDYFIIVVNPGININTSKAYSLYDASISENSKKRDVFSLATLEEEYFEKPPSMWRFFNSFYQVISKKHPLLDEIKKDFSSLRADYVGLSGSGSSIFGIFSQQSSAERAEKALKNKYTQVWLVKPLDRKPEAVLKY